MRMRRTANINEKLNKMSNYIVFEPEGIKGKWHELFGNENPIHLELGMGKGSFISVMSKRYPDINYLGLERVEDIIYKAACREEIQESPNVKLLLADVENLPFYFNQMEIERIYLNFSDPWPKNRHEKRRITHPRFLDIYKKLLKKGGEIFLKTDNEDFFDFSLLSIVETGYSLRKITYDLHKTNFAENVMTEYEQKFAAVGKPICRCEAITPLD
ncbi:MAG: tRNA (guanosine(46)-N7)-methyltransferase TrmB [Firmicutes bacterium HGW-Firmicutes-12]|jgi:tRNA (guanine-N7-)-methyltransferase|nr:MAG: tRNA (guanosine(46)-N7)-methyltransferase TrmB [Firmicutes bacterium HGW-Firmicutes-12]